MRWLRSMAVAVLAFVALAGLAYLVLPAPRYCSDATPEAWKAWQEANIARIRRTLAEAGLERTDAPPDPGAAPSRPMHMDPMAMRVFPHRRGSMPGTSAPRAR